MKIAPPNPLAKLFSNTQSDIFPRQLLKYIAPPLVELHFSIFKLLISIFLQFIKLIPPPMISTIIFFSFSKASLLKRFLVTLEVFLPF